LRFIFPFDAIESHGLFILVFIVIVNGHFNLAHLHILPQYTQPLIKLYFGGAIAVKNCHNLTHQIDVDS
jgi:hypothetical protein